MRQVKGVFRGFLWLICLAALFQLVRSIVHEPAGSGNGPSAILTTDGAWCWLADPRAVTHRGRYERTYVGWVNRAGDVKIGCYDHQTKRVETATLRRRLQRDDHANPAILVRQDGHIVVFYSAHGGREMFYRISRVPEEIASWGEELRLGTNTPVGGGYTYPNVARLTKGGERIYLFWRGGNWKPTFAESNDGIRWTDARTLILGGGARPYVKLCSNEFDTIHLAFTDGHPNEESGNNIYYAQYRDGAFYRADGSRIKGVGELPLNPSEADQVYDSRSSGARAWIWDIAADRLGRPVIVYATFPKETDHLYRYARWNGKAWENHDVVSGGSWFPQTPKGQEEREPYYSGGIVLDRTNPAVVYLSKPTDGVFEIERWSTPDGGRTWASEMITRDSHQNNVRPCVPVRHTPGGLELIWMRGEYLHFTNYRTALRFKIRSS